MHDELVLTFKKIKDPVEQRKAIFDFVRDIPYSTVTPLTTVGVINERKGSCLTKTMLLAELFGELGYKTRHVTLRYRLPDFPKEVSVIPGQIDYHHALQVLIEGRWILVDATYDSPLEKLGFTVNDWDGVHDTNLAHVPLAIKNEGIENADFDREFAEWEQEIEKAERLHPKEFEEYSDKFNEILEEARNE
ncbi:MAG: transglutaminase-like domain-containing protein [bacterium]